MKFKSLLFFTPNVIDTCISIQILPKTIVHNLSPNIIIFNGLYKPYPSLSTLQTTLHSLSADSPPPTYFLQHSYPG